MGYCASLFLTLYAASAYSATIVAAAPPAGPVVAAMQTASGNYITAVNGGGLGGPDTGPAAVALHTDATVAGPWETFTVVWLNSTYTKFALRTSDGKYVTAVHGGGIGGPNDRSSPIHTDATSVAAWERLRFTFLPSNRLTINVPNGRFLTAVDGGGVKGADAAPIRTDAVTCGAWESFTLIISSDVSGASPAPTPAPVPAPNPVKLPANEGAWLVDFGRSGGVAGGFVRYSINSAGEGSTSRDNGTGRQMIPPSLLANVERQVRAAQTQAWVSANGECNDCRRTVIDLSLRQAGGAVITHTARWTLLPSGSPSNALALVDAVESALRSVPAER